MEVSKTSSSDAEMTVVRPESFSNVMKGKSGLLGWSVVGGAEGGVWVSGSGDWRSDKDGEKNSTRTLELNEVFTCMAACILDSNKNANAIWITGLTAEIFASQ